MAKARRVVVTGVGLVTPLGPDVETSWEGLINGTSGIGRITLFDASTFPVQIAAEVKGVNGDHPAFHNGLSNFVGRASRFGVLAGQQAIDNAELDIESMDPFKFGVSMGGNEEYAQLSSFGKLFSQERIYESLRSRHLSYLSGPTSLGRIWAVRRSANVPSNILSILFGAKGPNSTSSTACASSGQAIGKAMRLIEYGDADVMLTGGCDSLISEFPVAGFGLLGALSKNNERPEKASRPFDLRRDGFVLGEGSGILVLEELSHAKRRGAPILAELSGFGTSSNAYRITDSPPDGQGADLAMINALKDAGMESPRVDYINAHGTSTLLNDRSETAAVKKVFGQDAYRIPVSSNKSMIGHLIASAGAVEIIFSILTMVHGLVPPTINLENQDPVCDLDYVPNATREAKVNTVLSNSFAFGGQNASLVVERYRERPS
jgi:3-oxoacyl-[acyl-carrier-protein] synthase II